MFARILKFFGYTLVAAPRRHPHQSMMDAQKMQIGIDAFRKAIWRLRDYGMKSIPAVECPVKFGGYGFVEGRTKGVIINKSLVLTEADSDMDLVEACVLVDRVPCLILEERYCRLTVTTIAGQDYIHEIIAPSGQICSTVADLEKLPGPIQKVLRDIFTFAYLKRVQVKDDIAIEKMLEY